MAMLPFLSAIYLAKGAEKREPHESIVRLNVGEGGETIEEEEKTAAKVFFRGMH